ncbi:Protein of unknown function [Limimonas halophila]|uniref:Sigma-70, region 4 n=1 Tax=Limimonas halophila TaxID=1082479 RepID=A0A1G7RL72_9PROT|nr:DUF742 domain-containing protein [Limimonas halophila]SDG11511.1 Protein of unknown function [Limimonas halophila]
MSPNDHPTNPGSGPSTLGEQHRWVMRLALDGYSVHAIAGELRLPVDVVETLLTEAITHARGQIR